ncbi:acetolactate synthase, large subunit [Desulfobulbus propionicus DSM 2032]|uniref:Acetolactate synthase n=1 Tax=Desulfobulbus propionicus (strain ATCC 33891 / DSM 2032 / VKM B-1956 / 1pr3) TaxID=577650 RepID=A0A7U3YJN0_DESPD|nr:acetolactate synthase large subunit [Desulfobulbus propionicus]ADW16622.1 acetolactate synthase, large subunit [Desulfobulbus propionicus DSM 2032]
MSRLNGAQLIIGFLERQGIRIVSGIPGGANLPLYDALASSPTIRHVLARHEQGAGFIAQGMARASGQIGVCFATSGPGATNILTALADAFLDSVPLVCITGQVARSLLGTDAFQEVDTYGLSMPITKHNYLVRSAAELLTILPKAFHLAGSGRPGPVLIDVPKDVQTEVVEFGAWPELVSTADHQPGCPESIRTAATMINEAERPILYLGGGVIHAGAAAEARRLAEQGAIPTVMTLMGLGILPSDHPLSLGMLGMHACRATNLAMEECDLLIAAGVRFDDRATGRISDFCPKAKVIHVDIDASEINKLRPADAGITGDARHAFAALLPQVRERQRSAWNGRIRQLQQDYPRFQTEDFAPGRPFSLIRKVAELAGPEAIISTDVGKHQMWVAQAYPLTDQRQLLTSGGLGTMGFGLPAAIGASLAFPERPVVCFSGDGSLQMNIQELATAVEQRAPVKIVVLNNQSLGLVRQQQRLFYEQHYFASSYGIAVDFAAIARGFGMQAYDLGSADNPDTLLCEAMRHPGPCLINVPIDIEAEVTPMVPPGAANTTMIGDSYACN